MKASVTFKPVLTMAAALSALLPTFEQHPQTLFVYLTAPAVAPIPAPAMPPKSAPPTASPTGADWRECMRRWRKAAAVWLMAKR